MGKKQVIEVPDGFEVEWQKAEDGSMSLKLVKEKSQLPVMERIKTFQDALKELGEEHELVKEWDDIEGVLTNDLAAYLKLRIIVAALNEGWEPQFTTSEYRYYPYFVLYTKKEVDEMTEDQKKELWLFGGSSNNESSCGLASAHSSDAWTYSDAYRSARLALKSRELAIYCGKQFIDIWAEYVYLNK